jgi:malate/lactate dehydrogenase
VVGRQERFCFSYSDRNIDSQSKKRFRLAIFRHLKDCFIPFHAVCLSKDNNGYLIVGPSGSGKSTLAQALLPFGFEVLANDMVVCWRNGNDLFAGDVNYVTENQGKQPISIEKIFFLTTDVRDSFLPGETEIESYYIESLRPVAKIILKKYLNKFKSMVEIRSIALGNRGQIERWVRLFMRYVNVPNHRNVGILGWGVIGSHVGNLLLDENWVNQINILDRRPESVSGDIMDMQSANNNINYHLCYNDNELVRHSDILVVCFRCHKSSGGNQENERFKHYLDNWKVIWSLSRAVRNNNYAGKIIVVTNPVDVFSWLLYYFSNLNDDRKFDGRGLTSDQIMGVGLGLDFGRVQLTSNRFVEVLGEHGDRLILASLHGRRLYLLRDQSLRRHVLNYSMKVRESSKSQRTMYGPVHEILRLMRTLKNNEGVVRLSSLDNNGYFLGDVFDYSCGLLKVRYEKEDIIEKRLSAVRNSHRIVRNKILKLLLNTNL